MKRKILIFLILFMAPLKIYALTGDVVLNCDKTSIKVNDEVTCAVGVDVTNGGIVSFKGKIELSNNLELVRVNRDSGWQGDDNTLDFMLYTDVAKNGNVSIGIVTAKAKTDTNSTESISVTGISLGDEAWNENAKANVVKQITLTKNVPAVDPTPENPTDNPPENPTDNPPENPTDNPPENPTDNPPENPTDEPEIPGGTGGGETMSSNADIKSLTIEGHSINFSKGTTSYNVKLADNEETLGLSVVLDDEKAKYEVSNNYQLVNGDTITIKVVAEDGTEKNYFIKIQKDVQQDVAVPRTDMNISVLQSIAAVIFIGVTIAIIVFINKKKETV